MITEPDDDRMDIDSPAETQVLFDANGGTDYQISEAKEVLKLGEKYTVLFTDIHDYITYVFFAECPDHRFNSCLFAKVPE